MDLMLKEVNKLLDSNEKPSAVVCPDEVISVPPIQAAPVIGSGNPNCSSAPIKAAPLTTVQSYTITAKNLSDNKLFVDDNSVVNDNPSSFGLPAFNPFGESKSSGGGSIMGGGGGMRKADDFPLEEESFKSLVSTICQKHFAGTYMRHAYYDSTSEAIANEVFSLIQRNWTKK